MARHVVARVEDIPPGTRRLFDVSGRAVLVFNLAGEFFALNNRCPHLAGSLDDGIQTGITHAPEPGIYETVRRGEFIKCPWHGWTFDIRTGKSWCDPETIRLRQYKAFIEHGAELVAESYAAETIPIHVEDDYIVVET